MISVITPCINLYTDDRCAYFTKMMESIHNQTYTNIEHIVIDGESNDGTVDFLKTYENHGWITTLISEKDSGIYDAMNKGITRARGIYVRIMNTDDYLIDLDYFHKAVAVLDDSEYDFVHADKIIESRIDGSESIKRGNERVAFFRMPFRHQTIIVRRSLFEEIGMFDTNYKIASDYKFALKMLLAGKKGFHFPSVVLRSRDGGASSYRTTCITEVSQVLFEMYGRTYGLTLEDCTAIYTQQISHTLHEKIVTHITDSKIRASLQTIIDQHKGLI